MLSCSHCCRKAFRPHSVCRYNKTMKRLRLGLTPSHQECETALLLSTSSFSSSSSSLMSSSYSNYLSCACCSSLLTQVRFSHNDISSLPPEEQQQSQQEENVKSEKEAQEVKGENENNVHREEEVFDVIVVGAGPAGLAAAIRLKQLAGDAKDEFRVGVVEKGSEVGAHILSGACLEPHSLDELLPEWRTNATFGKTDVTRDLFYVLRDATHAIRVPWIPPVLHNRGNIIISLGDLTKWLAEQAEALGVEIYPGFAAAQVVLDENEHYVKGVQLHDMGINKHNDKTDQYEPGMIFTAAQTVFAEGCRGSCTKMLEKRFKLRTEDNIQTYGLGIKEVWEVPKENAEPGRVLHTVGWPTNDTGHTNTYGGAFMYDYGDSLVSCGYVVGLDYANPYIRPYMEMQKWKTHPMIRSRLANGRPLYYGARALVEGGLTSLPTLHFPGGVLVGDTAGFLNLTKIKGSHTAMKSGILAAEAIYADAFANGKSKEFGVDCTSYNDRFKESWLYKELYKVRNVRQQFHKNFYWGMCYTALTTTLTHGKEPWTAHHTIADHSSLKPISECTPIDYPKPDNTLTFDLLTNLSRSGTTHNANQPCHLKLRDESIPEKVNLPKYGGPEARYCPAGVYEYVDGKLVINAQNCVHCKTCDIKDPRQNIDWAVPEGGGGPNYQGQMERQKANF